LLNVNNFVDDLYPHIKNVLLFFNNKNISIIQYDISKEINNIKEKRNSEEIIKNNLINKEISFIKINKEKMNIEKIENSVNIEIENKIIDTIYDTNLLKIKQFLFNLTLEFEKEDFNQLKTKINSFIYNIDDFLIDLLNNNVKNNVEKEIINLQTRNIENLTFTISCVGLIGYFSKFSKILILLGLTTTFYQYLKGESLLQTKKNIKKLSDELVSSLQECLQNYKSSSVKIHKQLSDLKREINTMLSLIDNDNFNINLFLEMCIDIMNEIESLRNLSYYLIDKKLIKQNITKYTFNLEQDEKIIQIKMTNEFELIDIDI